MYLTRDILIPVGTKAGGKDQNFVPNVRDNYDRYVEFLAKGGHLQDRLPGNNFPWRFRREEL